MDLLLKRSVFMDPVRGGDIYEHGVGMIAVCGDLHYCGLMDKKGRLVTQDEENEGDDSGDEGL